MDSHIRFWFLRRKWVLVAVGLPVLVGTWWAFQPKNCGSTKR